MVYCAAFDCNVNIVRINKTKVTCSWYIYDSILWSDRPATLITSASEHNGHRDLGPNDCVMST